MLSAQWLAFALATGTATIPAAAHAQVTAPEGAAAGQEGTTTIEGDEALALGIRLMLASGNLEGALGVLDSRPDLASRVDVRRLRAELLFQLGRHAESLAVLESLLGDNPSDATARLQLAEVHRAAGRRDLAATSYQLALAGDLDPARGLLATARLTELGQLRGWSLATSFSVASDSNVNSATDNTAIDIFGLPFVLDETARRRPGLTSSLFADFDGRYPLQDGLVLTGGASALIADSEGRALDLMVGAMSAGVGVRLATNMSASLTANSMTRWYGGDVLDSRQGFQSVVVHHGDGYSFRGHAHADVIDDKMSDARDGWEAGVGLAHTRYLSPTSFWRVAMSFDRREAEVTSEGYGVAQVTSGWLGPAPFSTTVHAELFLRYRRHLGMAIAFGDTREDTEAGLNVRIAKRDWNVLGFSPFVAVSISRNDSTLALYAFSRARAETGFTREF